VTRPELLAPWLRVINALAVPITGIYMLPVVTLSIADRLDIKRPNLLIVSKNESGLRQTFCKDGKLRVSRLTPPRDDSDQSTAFYAEEINSTRMYLDALTVTHVDDILTVLILDQDGSLANLRGAITDHRPNMECLRLGPTELAETLGSSKAEVSSCPDALHLHLLATVRPIMNLAPPTLKTRLQVHLIGKIVYAAAAGIVAVGAFWSLAYAVLILQASGEIADLTQQASSYQRQYQAVTERFPEAPATSELLKDSVEAAVQIDTLRQTPSTLMVVLGSALNNSPDIGLNRIEWIHGKPDLVETGLQAADLSPHLIKGFGQFGLIGAEVLSYEGDHQAALRNIRSFTRLLAEDERVAEVSVIRLPLDLDPNANLNGSTATEQATQSAPFEIAVVIKANRRLQ
ncbi:MAG: hypothetical protein GTO41_08205, partial [Burkholderiales bacterium]|nr:hypothetical protein [Burkholderiales bacterium]